MKEEVWSLEARSLPRGKSRVVRSLRYVTYQPYTSIIHSTKFKSWLNFLLAPVTYQILVVANS
jgi:hypothetical protein